MKDRTLGLADAMILVVAVAVALAVNRLNWGGVVARPWQPLNGHDLIDHIFDLVVPQFAAGTIAAVAMRLRNPRPSSRRLARQPGWVACLAALAALLVIICWVVLNEVAGRCVEFSEHLTKAGVHSRGSFWLYPLTGRNLAIYSDRMGFAIGGAWLALWLSGRWRSEPTWLDRFGRAIGWLWLILNLAFWLRCFSI